MLDNIQNDLDEAHGDTPKSGIMTSTTIFIVRSMRTTGSAIPHRPAATLAPRGGRPGSGITLTFTFPRTVAEEGKQSKGLKQSQSCISYALATGCNCPNTETYRRRPGTSFVMVRLIFSQA